MPLEGERDSGAAVSPTYSSSGQSMPQKLACTPNEPNTLITISMESETPRSGEILQVHLASVHWHADDPNGLGGQTDGSHGEMDVSRAWTDTLNMSN